ncbi:type VI secretion system protein TssA [Pseudochelatococcus contaminans]|uniref:Type VI secretion system protein ImpA n=1 Tax=Pseudochelatococcus contaminans TaxID=1538103 RepID=A0A7W5Z1J7_9HYPH|nr:type VI secretion system protein TssA [Pseudochelatococcus contaminans]MBB3808164.1 type VI secretion system protein ImpA [Pseudochelatococcus contaminans]
MTFEPTFDFELLLEPFDGDTPSGVDPRLDLSPTSRFLRMKDARASARRKERAIDVDGDAPSPMSEWQEVAQLGVEILTEEGKDIEVASWLAEALLRLSGCAGLYVGIKASHGLVERFWDTLYPLPDEDGNESRLSPFIGLNGAEGEGTLIQPLRKIPLTASEPPYGLWQYHQAQEIEQISDSKKRDERIAAGALSLATFTEAVNATPASWYADLVAGIAAVREALDELSGAFAGQVGIDAPPAGSIRAVLQAIADDVNIFAADKLAHAARAAELEAAQSETAKDEESDSEDDDSGEYDEEAGNASTGRAVPSTRPVNREDGLRQLLQIATFFRETEPHSPISYTLEEVVRRGRMSFNELLQELIIDSSARHYFFIASGISSPEVESDSDE